VKRRLSQMPHSPDPANTCQFCVLFHGFPSRCPLTPNVRGCRGLRFVRLPGDCHIRYERHRSGHPIIYRSTTLTHTCQRVSRLECALVGDGVAFCRSAVVSKRCRRARQQVTSPGQGGDIVFTGDRDDLVCGHRVRSVERVSALVRWGVPIPGINSFIVRPLRRSAGRGWLPMLPR
jgi:hypothetical protein